MFGSAHWLTSPRSGTRYGFHVRAVQDRDQDPGADLQFTSCGGAHFESSPVCIAGRRAGRKETCHAWAFVVDCSLDELIRLTCRRTGIGVDVTRQHDEHSTGPRPWPQPQAGRRVVRGGSGGGSGSGNEQWQRRGRCPVSGGHVAQYCGLHLDCSAIRRIKNSNRTRGTEYGGRRGSVVLPNEEGRRAWRRWRLRCQVLALATLGR